MSTKLVAVAADPDPAPGPGGVRLNLGCNQRPQPGYVNVDIEAFPGVDVVTDLEKRWPWEDNTVDEISCADLPEHLREWYERPDDDLMIAAWDESRDIRDRFKDLLSAITKPKRTYGIIHFFNEAHRVLKPGGRLHCLIPSTDNSGRGWAQDPTHVSYWNENTLLYFLDPAAGMQTYRHLYPSLITARFRAKQVRTTMPNVLGVTYLEFLLEKA